MKLRFALALLPLALAACSEQDIANLKMPWDKPLETMPDTVEDPTQKVHVPPAVSPLKQPIETTDAAPKAAPTAEAKTLAETAFRASGNEPFWTVEIADGTARYITPEDQSGRNIAVKRINFARGVEYIGVLDGQPFSVTIRSQKCADSMSGKKFPMSAALRAKNQTNNGCAAPADLTKPVKAS